MRQFARGEQQAKGWFVGPWNSDVPAAVGYAIAGIDEPHYHGQMSECYLVARGWAIAVVEGRELTLDPGSVLVVEPGEVHTFIDSSPDYYHFVVHAPVVPGDKHPASGPSGADRARGCAGDHRTGRRHTANEADGPAVVMPLHDPTGQLLPHLQAVAPDLRRIFQRAFVSVTRHTAEAQPGCIGWLEGEPFFQRTTAEASGPIGHQLLSLYSAAVAASPPDQVLHLCFSDRVAFALQTDHRAQFIADVQSVRAADTPLLFQRSERAWRTHPANYREIEGMATRAGELLLGRRLDLTWCHLAIRAGLLAQVLPALQASDLSLLAEIVLALVDSLSTRDVDWLSWEDPFITGCDPEVLRQQREASTQETRKRLSYVVPIMDTALRRF